MNRIKNITICLSLCVTLSMVGCVCTPGYYSGMPQYAYHSSSVSMGCDTGCDTGCDPCGPIETGCGPADCGVIESSGIFCAPPRIRSCRTSLSHIGNGICLVGRGVLDIAATPFVAIGGILSSGCRYEVIAHCDTPCYSSHYTVQNVEPCGQSGSSCTSGCETCSSGYTEGIQYNTSAITRPPTLMPPFPTRKNTVVQAAYQEPTRPAVRFSQPK